MTTHTVTLEPAPYTAHSFRWRCTCGALGNAQGTRDLAWSLALQHLSIEQPAKEVERES